MCFVYIRIVCVCHGLILSSYFVNFCWQRLMTTFITFSTSNFNLWDCCWTWLSSKIFVSFSMRILLYITTPKMFCFYLFSPPHSMFAVCVWCIYDRVCCIMVCLVNWIVCQQLHYAVRGEFRTCRACAEGAKGCVNHVIKYQPLPRARAHIRRGALLR